jgi:hypothetical protein
VNTGKFAALVVNGKVPEVAGIVTAARSIGTAFDAVGAREVDALSALLLVFIDTARRLDLSLSQVEEAVEMNWTGDDPPIRSRPPRELRDVHVPKHGRVRR